MATIGSTIGPLGLLPADAAALRERLDLLTRQSASGRRGEAYGELGINARRAIDLRAELARREAYDSAVGRVLGRTATAQATLQRLSDIADEFMQESVTLAAGEAQRIGTIASAARAALEEVAGLLNTTHAGEYIFGGSDSATPPVTDAAGIAGSAMTARIAAAVAGLGGGNASAVLAETAAAATDTSAGGSVFSAFLEDPATGGGEARRSLMAGDGEKVAYGLFANRNAAATSDGATVGAWSRDLLRGLATLAALTPAQAEQGADYQALIGAVRDGLRSAHDALGEEAGALGLTEARLEKARTAHDAVATALTAQLGEAEEVDVVAVLTEMQLVRARLEASYRAIAMLSELSLTRFLG
jgi:flagellin-like hook-associated protein FlgL